MSTCTTDSEYKCLTNFLWVDADCKELDDQKKTSQSEFKELPLIVKWRSIPPPLTMVRTQWCHYNYLLVIRRHAPHSTSLVKVVAKIKQKVGC